MRGRLNGCRKVAATDEGLRASQDAVDGAVQGRLVRSGAVRVNRSERPSSYSPTQPVRRLEVIWRDRMRERIELLELLLRIIVGAVRDVPDAVHDLVLDVDGGV